MATEVEVKGDIFSNLPAAVSYRPGVELPCSISAVNLTEEDRQFMVLMKTFDRAGRQITEDALRFGGMAWFEVGAQDRESFDGIITSEVTDVTLGLFLIERDTGEVVDQVYAWLQGY